MQTSQVSHIKRKLARSQVQEAPSLNIFVFEDFRQYLREFLAHEELQTSGARKRLLQATGISSSFLTQVLSDKKSMSNEQGLEVALHFNLSEVETDYFILLLELDRAGTEKLKKRLRSKILVLQQQAQKISSKVQPSVVLSEEQKAIYYSNWIYTAIRNLVPTDLGASPQKLAAKLGLPLSSVESAVQFLLEIGLIKKEQGRLGYQPGYTHLNSNHPLILRHHQNWRQRGIARMDHYNEDHLHYTCPMAISKEAAKLIRARLAEEIKNLGKLLRDQPETAYCLNIDFFEY